MSIGEQMPKERDEILQTLGLVGQLGFRMVFSILAGFAAGLWLDRAVESRGVFLILGILLGVAGGFWSCYRVLMATLEIGCPDKSAKKRRGRKRT